MKLIKYLFLLYLFLAISCVDKDAPERRILNKMNESFKVYIRDNDLRKDLITKLTNVKALSYKELGEEDRENKDEVYEAKIYMQGTTSYMLSAKIYNLNDTVICYFNKDLKMLRLVNSNNPQ